MSLTGIDHVQLAMPPGSEETARGFYEGLLGIPMRDKPEDLAGRGGCWFEEGTLRVHLGVEEDFHPASKAHPSFLVDRLDELASRLRAAGVEIDEAVPLGGYDRFYVHDPFGNRIELMERKRPD